MRLALGRPRRASPLMAVSALTFAVVVAVGRSAGRRRSSVAAAEENGRVADPPPVPAPRAPAPTSRTFDAEAAAARVEQAAAASEDEPPPAVVAPAPLGTPARTARQLAKASATLAAGRDGDLEEAVHNVRKRIKRVRAAVRLTRGQLGEKAYRRENAELGAIGRSLGGARDAKVLVDTLDAVLADAPAEEHRRLAGLRMMLLAEHEVHAVRLRYGDGIATATARLRAAEERIAAWKLSDDTRDGLAAGVEQMYRRGRRAFRVVRDDPTAENLHALRKRAKDLWYATDLLATARGSEVHRLSRDARALTQLIGEDHDLAVLRDKARALRFTLPAKRDRRRLNARIDVRRTELQREALAAAAALYGPKRRDWRR